uniref:Sushi, von Willebrand factor type A, EGF and pentraxin domain-containing protein 1 n=1 Tax=Parastrongyloides trichosuri TaxID=131310 RepID=A0A0N5A018_PARTI
MMPKCYDMLTRLGFLLFLLLILFEKSIAIVIDSNDNYCPTNFYEKPRPTYCKKACSSDKQCKRGKKKCLCDGRCGMSCVNPRLHCPQLTNPENGHIIASNGFTFNSVVEYFCKPGYIISGVGQRRCQGNKQWSGSLPICRLQYKCGPPPELPYTINNGRSYNGQYDAGSEVTYQCTRGYSANFETDPSSVVGKQFYKAKCFINNNGFASWMGPDVKCRAISCGDPSVPLNGYRDGSLFFYPHEVKFYCYPGFHLVGPQTRKCESNGKWTHDKPSCQPTECSRPPDPLHGSVIGSSLSYESVISYSCNEGFRLVGQVQRFCTEEGVWAGTEPICEEIKCSPLPTLYNGYTEGFDTSYGTTVIFRCYEGMKHLGSPFTKCEEHGKWSHPVPQCLAHCKVPRINNGSIDKVFPDRLVQHGARLKVICNSKHETTLNPFITCNNGTWSHIPKCVPNKCKTWPPRLSHAKVFFTKSNHGSIAKYHCRQGFQPSSKNNAIKCMFGEWIMPKPKFRCIPLSCSHPEKTFGVLKDGNIMLEGQMGSYVVANYINKVMEGRSIAFSCNKGSILIGPPKASCVNGQWKPNVKPKCVSQTHATIEGQILWNRSKRNTSDFSDPNYRSLSHNRNTYHTKPICQLPIKLHSFFVTQESSEKILQSKDLITHGVHVRLVCLKGYHVVGPESTTCEYGVLTETLGFCKPMNCNLYDPNYINIAWITTFRVLNHGEDIEYTCKSSTDSSSDIQIMKTSCHYGKLKPEPFCVKPTFENVNYCAAPRIKDSVSVYKFNDSSLQNKEYFNENLPFFINGTFFHFHCSSNGKREDEAGAIQCINSEWVTRLIPCIDKILINNNRVSSQTSDNHYLNTRVCKLPALNYTNYKIYNINFGKHTLSPNTIFPHGTILLITCSMYGYVSDFKYQTSELKCRRGRWKRPKDIIRCPDIKDTCLYEMDPAANLSVYHVQGKRPVLFNEYFQYLDKLQFTCSNNYLSQIRGVTEVSCLRGKWSAPFPKCHVLNPLNEDHSAPPVHFIVDGPNPPNYYIAPKGELYVKEGSTLRLLCLHKQTTSDDSLPKWRYDSSYRNYPLKSDANYPGKPTTLSAFELSITNTLPEDSGLYHCTYSNTGATRSIKVIITDATCPPINTPSKHLLVHFSQKTNFIGSMAQFSCPTNYLISGPRALFCMPNKKWSHKPPTCIQNICHPLTLTPESKLRLSITSYKYGGIATFSCPPHYDLEGNHHMHCLANGSWSKNTENPKCIPKKCSENIKIPANGYVSKQYIKSLSTDEDEVEEKNITRYLLPYNEDEIYSPPFYPGHLLIFSCKNNYMLTGNDFILCQKDGTWSEMGTKCEAVCRFPGTQNNVEITTQPKDYYKVGSRIVYICKERVGFKLNSHNVLECLPNGSWNRKVPKCIKVF